MRDIKNNQSKNWNLSYLGENPNINIKNIYDIDNESYYFLLSENQLKYNNVLQLIQYRNLKSTVSFRDSQCEFLKTLSRNTHMKYKRIFSYNSQDFYKWYCGNDVMRR